MMKISLKTFLLINLLMMKNKKGLYIHIPFCNHICNYCDFTKIIYFPKLADLYIRTLIQEIDSYHIKEVKSIYVGGGTPTSLSVPQLEILLKKLYGFVTKDVEYTFESNVETLSDEKLQLMYKYGVNRLSIGVESCDDNMLKFLNRHHTYEEVKKCIASARNIGFKNINVDLILGLPNTDLEFVKNDIKFLSLLNVEHISTYSLLVNPNTVFYLNNIQEQQQDNVREYYDYVHNFLSELGYQHYEVSNFAKLGYESRHNLIYWNDEEYYGIGLGASGYIDKIRYTNTKSINKYLKKEFISNKEYVDDISDITYYLMLKLRTIYGFNLKDFKDKFGFDLLSKSKDCIDEFINNKLLIIKDNILHPTYEGMMVLDTILIKIINSIENS